MAEKPPPSPPPPPKKILLKNFKNEKIKPKERSVGWGASRKRDHKTIA
jgi:hypothetical protein